MFIQSMFIYLFFSATASVQIEGRGSYLYPSYTTADGYNRLGGVMGKFFRGATDSPGDDLITWEARAGANYLTKKSHLFQLLAVYRNEPFSIKARGMAASVRIPIHPLWDGIKSTMVGVDMEWLNHTGLSFGSSLVPDKEINNRTYLAAIGAGFKLPLLLLGVDLGTQSSRADHRSQNFLSVSIGL